MSRSLIRRSLSAVAGIEAGASREPQAHGSPFPDCPRQQQGDFPASVTFADDKPASAGLQRPPHDPEEADGKAEAGVDDARISVSTVREMERP
jgi:hypothetical protein